MLKAMSRSVAIRSATGAPGSRVMYLSAATGKSTILRWMGRNIASACPDEVVKVGEAHGVSGGYRSEAQGLGQEVLPDTQAPSTEHARAWPGTPGRSQRPTAGDTVGVITGRGSSQLPTGHQRQRSSLRSNPSNSSPANPFSWRGASIGISCHIRHQKIVPELTVNLRALGECRV